MTSAMPDWLSVNHFVAVRERQVVVRVNVEPPQQLLLPRRERFPADGLDVGERHQAQHLQAILDADEVGELPHDLGILGIAAERDHRHPRDAWPRGIPRRRGLLVEREAIEHLTRHPRALRGVVLVAPLADVVKQQRQHEQLGRVDFSEQPREALAIRPAASVSRSRFRIVRSVCSSTVYL